MSPKYLRCLSLPIALAITLWSPTSSQGQAQLPYWTKAAPATIDSRMTSELSKCKGWQGTSKILPTDASVLAPQPSHPRLTVARIWSRNHACPESPSSRGCQIMV
jgi:hypothetical protein